MENLEVVSAESFFPSDELGCLSTIPACAAIDPFESFMVRAQGESSTQEEVFPMFHCLEASQSFPLTGVVVPFRRIQSLVERASPDLVGFDAD